MSSAKSFESHHNYSFYYGVGFGRCIKSRVFEFQSHHFAVWIIKMDRRELPEALIALVMFNMNNEFVIDWKNEEFQRSLTQSFTATKLLV